MWQCLLPSGCIIACFSWPQLCSQFSPKSATTQNWQWLLCSPYFNLPYANYLGGNSQIPVVPKYHSSNSQSADPGLMLTLTLSFTLQHVWCLYVWLYLRSKIGKNNRVVCQSCGNPTCAVCKRSLKGKLGKNHFGPQRCPQHSWWYFVWMRWVVASFGESRWDIWRYILSS